MVLAAGCLCKDATIHVPGYLDDLTQRDVCGASVNCDVQGRKAISLLHHDRSIHLESDPYSFVGGAFNVHDSDGLALPFNCGSLEPNAIEESPPTTSEALVDDSKYERFKGSLARALAPILSGDVEKTLTSALRGNVRFERTVYTVTTGAVPGRETQCMQHICVTWAECQHVPDYALIVSATFVTLSADSENRIASSLKATLGALGGVASAAVDDDLTKVLHQSTDGMRFVAYAGWDRTLAEGAGGAPAAPAVTCNPPDDGSTDPLVQLLRFVQLKAQYLNFAAVVPCVGAVKQLGGNGPGFLVYPYLAVSEDRTGNAAEALKLLDELERRVSEANKPFDDAATSSHLAANIDSCRSLTRNSAVSAALERVRALALARATPTAPALIPTTNVQVNLPLKVSQ